MRASTLVALIALASPTCGHDTPADSASSWRQHEDSNPSRCYEESVSTCGAENLPRIAPGSWSEQAVQAFMGRFGAGTVAVKHEAGQPSLVADCKLAGSYTEVGGKKGSGRLWATNRPLLLPSEVGAGCDDATHLVATFVTRDGWFSAILVPLPCPPISETTPATRCIGNGATGPERQARADDAIRGRSKQQWKADLALALDTYSIAPDHWRALQVLYAISSECAFKEQADWLANHYTTVQRMGDGEYTAELGPEQTWNPAPTLDVEASEQRCLYQPVFRKCFPGHFEAAPGITGCWELAHHGAGPE